MNAGASHGEGRAANVVRRDRLVTAIEVVLLLNALPAFVVLTAMPSKTDSLFVWTVKPEASALLLAAMYGNAAILATLALLRSTWPSVRATFVVFALFSVAATIVTFFHLDPFLAHRRYFLVYWLVNYFFLLVATPAVFLSRERRNGGRLPKVVPLARSVRTAALLAAAACLVAGAALLIGPGLANHLWPWSLTPLVARLIGVWLTALGGAFLWTLWDGDSERTRSIFPYVPRRLFRARRARSHRRPPVRAWRASNCSVLSCAFQPAPGSGNTADRASGNARRPVGAAIGRRGTYTAAALSGRPSSVARRARSRRPADLPRRPSSCTARPLSSAQDSAASPQRDSRTRGFAVARCVSNGGQCAPECAPVAPRFGGIRRDSTGSSLRRTAVPKPLLPGRFRHG